MSDATPKRPDAQRRLRARLKARAFAILADLAAGGAGQAAEVAARDEAYRVTVKVGPADAPAEVPALRPGLHFSALEAAVWQALAAAGVPLNGKKLAAQLGRTYDTTFRVVMANLRDRKVILKTHEGWVPTGAKPAG